jgi:hypothetical protein
MKTRLEDSLFSETQSTHYMQLAGKLASSEFVPKSFRGKPADLFICWEVGYQIGMAPAQAMQCIAVVNGRPCIWGDDMLALCMSHNEFEDILEEPIANLDGVITGYKCTVKRKGKADKVNIFTLDMAKKAGLLAKGGVWNTYPERMLKLRARGFSLRDAFPDALKGIKPREEVNDYIDAEYTTVEDSSLSRTELLKKDFLTKTGKLKDENIEPVEAEIHPLAGEEAAQSEEPESVDLDGKKADHLHSEIERLIAEKGFTEERLDKALKYYESPNIMELSIESMEHLIKKLNKL